MAHSLLGAFVRGTRQMLSAQLIVSICSVALAGWTLGVTNELIRERDRLRERVIQLEETMAARGEMPPSSPAVVASPMAQAYPGSIAAETEAATGGAALSRMIGDVFAPPPPVRTVVLHARSQADEQHLRRIGDELTQTGNIRAIVTVTPPGRPAGYAYYDGRQSRAAAALVQQFNDIARRHDIALWSAQLRGTALPARGEYTAARLDIVLPPLPSAPPQRAPTRQDELDPDR